MITYPSRRRKMKARFKANSMMQWIEHNWNKTFINLPSLPWKSEISGAIHLEHPSLTAGRQADEIQVNFEIFTIHYTANLRFLALLNQGTYSIIRAVLMYSRWFFQVKLITRPFLRCENLRNHYQSLLYSTTILYDNSWCRKPFGHLLAHCTCHPCHGIPLLTWTTLTDS